MIDLRLNSDLKSVCVFLKALTAFATEATLFHDPPTKIPNCILVTFIFLWVLTHQLASCFKSFEWAKNSPV
jgi:hypothetical protein